MKGKHRKHVVGTNEYKQELAIYERAGRYGPSELIVDEYAAQELVLKHAGSGKISYNIEGDNFDISEVIIDNDVEIGYVFNNLNGEKRVTTVFKIHYGREGVHIVPDYPSKKKGKGK